MNEVDPQLGSDFESELATIRLANAQRRRRRWLKAGLVFTTLLLVGGFVLGSAIEKAREASRMTSCNCQLKQFGLAMHNYHDANGCFPPAIVLGPDGSAWHSWRVLILPYLECDSLYQTYRFDEPWDGPNNKKLLNEMPPIFSCPSRPSLANASLFGSLTCGLLGCTAHPETARGGLTSYVVAVGGKTVFPGVKPIKVADITDGTSNTILVGESTRTRIPWTKPEDVFIDQHPQLGDRDGFSGQHTIGSDGVNVLLGDGTVKFLRTDLPQDLINALFTRNGGEPVGNDW